MCKRRLRAEHLVGDVALPAQPKSEYIFVMKLLVCRAIVYLGLYVRRILFEVDEVLFKTGADFDSVVR